MLRWRKRLDRFFDSKIENYGNDERWFHVDVIRAFAIVLVVVLHTASTPMKHYSAISPSAWWVSNLSFSFAHQGVPLFVMISGLLLLNPAKEESIEVFFRKRFNKVVIPFLFWAVIYFCWRVFYNDESFTIYEALRLFIKGPIYYHFWFIYLILGLYLATPILRVYIKAASVLNIFYFIIMWFLFSSLFPMVGSAAGIRIGIRIFLFTGMIGYFLVGHLLVQAKFSDKNLWLLVAIVFGATLFTSLGTHLLTIWDGGQYNDFFIKVTQPNLIAISLGTFLLLLKWPPIHAFSNARIPSILIRHIAGASFGIYLLHPIILELLEDGWLGFQLDAMSSHPAVGIPATVVTTMVIAFFVVVVLKRIPVIKMAVP